MFKSIRLVNYQAHKETELELHRGINVFIGNSDSGKSSILRSLEWVRTNRPLGNAHVSFWNRNKKDEPVGATSSTITTSEGIAVSREKSGEYNGYRIGDKNLNVIGTDVPSDVMDVLNISDVNVSNQDDKPFLISESPGYVATYLNKLVHLDKIDTVLSRAESRKREIRNEVKHLEEQNAKAEIAIKELEFVDEADALLDKMKSAIRANEAKEQAIDSLKRQLGVLQALEDVRGLRKTLDAGLDLVSQIDSKNNELSVKVLLIGKLKHYIKFIHDYESTSELSELVTKGKTIIKRLDNVVSEGEALKTRIATLSGYIDTLSQDNHFEAIFKDLKDKGAYSLIDRITGTADDNRNIAMKMYRIRQFVQEAKRQEVLITMGIKEIKELKESMGNETIRCPKCGTEVGVNS